MGEPKKTWYETNNDLVIKSTREGIRGILSNFWAPKIVMGKASAGYLSRFLLGQYQERLRQALMNT